MNLEAHVKTLNGVLEKYEFGKEPGELYEPINYILELGGKRIRPLLVLLAGKIYGLDALGVEIEDMKNNTTRFLIMANKKQDLDLENFLTNL